MRPLLSCSLALLLLLGVACSSSGSKAQASKKLVTTTTTTVKTLSANEVNAKASPYCATWAQIRALGGAKITGNQQTDTAALREQYAKLDPLAQQLAAEAPASIKADAEYAAKQVAEVARTGSQEPFMRDGASQVQQRLAKYALDSCAVH